MLQELYDDLRNDTIQVTVDQLTGTLPVGSGGTGTSVAFTAGSVVFAGTSGVYAQDQSNLFWDDTNNRLGIGTAVPDAPLQISGNTVVSVTPTAGTLLHLQAADSTGNRILFDSYATNSAFTFRRANGTAALPTALASGDIIGNITFIGYGTGSAYLSAATPSIRGTAAETWTNTASGSYLDFYTTPKLSTTLTHAVRFDSTGNVGIGTPAPGAKLVVSQNAAALPTPPSFTVMQFANADSSSTRLLLDTFQANGNYTARRANNTAATPQALAINDQILLLTAIGYGATAYSSGGRAQIGMEATQAWTDTNQGTRMIFLTTPDGSTTIAERMRIDQSGNIGVGTTTFGASMAGGFAMLNGTAPTGNVTDVFQFYSADQAAGNAAPHFRTENGSVVKLYKTGTYSPTNVTTDRSYDANSTTLDELADVLGSLIADLQLTGLLG